MSSIMQWNLSCLPVSVEIATANLENYKKRKTSKIVINALVKNTSMDVNHILLFCSKCLELHEIHHMRTIHLL